MPQMTDPDWRYPAAGPMGRVSRSGAVESRAWNRPGGAERCGLSIRNILRDHRRWRRGDVPPPPPAGLRHLEWRTGWNRRSGRLHRRGNPIPALPAWALDAATTECRETPDGFDRRRRRRWDRDSHPGGG